MGAERAAALLNEMLTGQLVRLGYTNPPHAAQAEGPHQDPAWGAAGNPLCCSTFSCLLWKLWAGTVEL